MDRDNIKMLITATYKRNRSFFKSHVNHEIRFQKEKTYSIDSPCFNNYISASHITYRTQQEKVACYNDW